MLQIVHSRKNEMEDLKNRECRKARLKKKIKDMLILERKGEERPEDWVPEEVKEDDPVEVFMADHAPTWKKLTQRLARYQKI